MFNTHPLTTVERVKAAETYYKNADSVASGLRADFDRYNSSSERTIDETVKKFEESRSVTDLSTSMYH